MLGVCTGASDACVSVGPADGAPCDDALFCNGADTCLGGVCTHAGDPCAGASGCLTCNEATDQCDVLAGTPCDTCKTCDALGACVPAPRPTSACKRPIESATAQLTIKNDSPDTKDRLKWTWKKGDATTLAELGRPDVDDGYALCVFDPSSPAGALVLSARAPAGAAWRAAGKGFKYKSASHLPDGLQALALTSGVAGKAKMSVKGAGDPLLLPAVPAPLPLPLVVQLQDDAGGCWEAAYSAASANDGTKFKAKSD